MFPAITKEEVYVWVVGIAQMHTDSFRVILPHTINDEPWLGGGGEHHRGIAPGVESVTKPRTATRATFTLAPSYHLPSSYGSAMVRLNRMPYISIRG